MFKFLIKYVKPYLPRIQAYLIYFYFRSVKNGTFKVDNVTYQLRTPRRTCDVYILDYEGEICKIATKIRFMIVNQGRPEQQIPKRIREFERELYSTHGLGQDRNERIKFVTNMLEGPHDLIAESVLTFFKNEFNLDCYDRLQDMN